MLELRPYQATAIAETWKALKDSDEPVLLMSSVGSGKSLMIASILLDLERLGKRALCIVNNAELVRSNAETFKSQGGNPSLYCNALGTKDSSGSVVFGTPQSILNGIKNNKKISKIKFNIIVVDEAHMIAFHNYSSTFMRILRYYKQEYPAMRVLGATGTAFRYKGEPIVGDDCLFKKQVGNITTAWLIEQGYLVKPVFEVDEEHTIDFSNVKLNSMGKFDNKQLESVIDKNQRLTGQILKHTQNIMTAQNRFGCFVFCSSKKHCTEALAALPADKSAIITADTPQKERTIILNKARNGEIKYLINIAVLTVGVDVPKYDTLLFLRPTESMVLAVQMIGRVLRLAKNKESALILDCAGNIDRFQDWDDPVILDAIKQTRDKDKELIFSCPECETMNTEHARRCIGIVDSKRCGFYFEWKDCVCGAKNDLVSRYCRKCDAELIDPNAKLSIGALSKTIIEVKVLSSKYSLKQAGKYPSIFAEYMCLSPSGKKMRISENYTPSSSEKAKNVFYGRFAKQHLKDSSFWYPHLQNPIYLKAMLNHLMTPDWLKLKWDTERWTIYGKVFHNLDTPQLPSLPHQDLSRIQQHNHVKAFEKEILPVP